MSDVTSFTNVNESGADADPAAEGDGEQSQAIPRSCSDKTSAID